MSALYATAWQGMLDLEELPLSPIIYPSSVLIGHICVTYVHTSPTKEVNL